MRLMFGPGLPLTATLLVMSAAALADAKGIGCFDVTTSRNSPSTRSVFAARHCQGGGVTWAPILGALVKRRGAVVPAPTSSSGMTGDVAILDGKIRFAIDEEGDAARFCSDDRGLLETIRTDYRQVNGDAAALERAMAEASPLAMECLGADGKPPPLPALLPAPVLPKEQASAAGARLARLRALLDREPAWCFAPDDPARRVGVLRFLPGDRVTQTLSDGRLVAAGAVVWPREGSGDDRMQLVLHSVQPGFRGAAGVFHLDLGPTGRLGETYADRSRTRWELIPGSSCLRSP